MKGGGGEGFFKVETKVPEEDFSSSIAWSLNNLNYFKFKTTQVHSELYFFRNKILDFLNKQVHRNTVTQENIFLYKKPFD